MVTVTSKPERTFVVVEFPQPLESPMSVGEAQDRVACWLQELMEEESLSFVAFAEGERLTAKGEMEEVMLFLIYDHANQEYTVWENWRDEWEDAVLIDGGGKANDDLLPPEQALAQWVAGFMMKNETNPGSHNLRYRLIEGDAHDEQC